MRKGKKMLRKRSLAVGLGLALILAAGFSGLALADGGEEPPVRSFDDIIRVLNKLLTWFATAFWIFAVGGSLYAGFLYLTAAGNTERVEKAKKQMTYVVIAIIIGLLAYGLPAILRNVLSEGSSGGSYNNNNNNSNNGGGTPVAYGCDIQPLNYCNSFCGGSGTCDVVSGQCNCF